MALVAGLVVVLAVIAIGAAWLLRPAAPHAATAADDTQAAALVGRLTVPAGAVSDATATACGVPSHYCISSPTLSHLDLFDDALRQLEGLGAAVKPQPCDTSLLLTGQCLATVTYRGGSLTVTAGDTSAADAVVTSWAAVTGSADKPVATHEPLPAATASDVVPPGWRGRLTCSQPAAGGCDEFQGTFLLDAARQPVVQALQAQVGTAGYRVSSKVDQAGTATRRGSTLLAASRFRGPAGTDQVLVLATVRDAGEFTQVTIYVSAV